MKPTIFQHSKHIFIYWGNFLVSVPNDHPHTAMEFVLEHPDQQEPGHTKFYDRVCMPDAVSIDVGAHVGLHSIRMYKAKLAKEQSSSINGHVLAFEPNKNFHDSFLENIRFNNYQIQLVEAAVSDENGVAEFVEYYNSGFSRLMKYDLQEQQRKNVFNVPTTTLDEHNFSLPVDVIKIDAEENELSVLRGATKTIKRFKPAIAIEISNYKSTQDVRELLTSWGYVFEGDNLSLDTIERGNYLLVHPSNAKKYEKQ